MNELQVKSESKVSYELQEKVLVGGDLSKLNADERLSYLKNLCESLGLNPLSRPFEYILLNGKLTLYARKDCTEQLRKVNSIAIDSTEEQIVHDSIYIVKAHAIDREGRKDIARGAVNIAGLKGDALANAIMKAETKAKRRVTLSICGLGFMDESETDTITEKNITQHASVKKEDNGKLEVKNTLPETTVMDEKAIEEKYNYLCERIVSSKTMEKLKENFDEAKKFAKSVKRNDYMELFAQYKDAKKEELEIEKEAAHESL